MPWLGSWTGLLCWAVCWVVCLPSAISSSWRWAPAWRQTGAEQQNVKGGTALVRMSFLLRYLVLFLILFAAAKSGRFQVLALVLPLVFVRPILMLGEFFRKSGEKKS